MRVTDQGVFFEGVYGSNTAATNGRIHFTDDTFVNVYLHPDILALLIGVCAHDFKLESESITTMITRLTELGKRQHERVNATKAAEGWKAAADQDKMQFIFTYLAGADKKKLKLIADMCKRMASNQKSH
jgi:hypothetical protein